MGLQEFSIQSKALINSISIGKKISFVVLIGGTITALTLLIMWAGKPEFQLLYSNLSPEDAGAIVTSLRERKIPYEISSSGNSILVPIEKVYELRLELASQGLPQGSGVGFEIFDDTKLGMTDFVQNVNYQRACQGELARTINGLTEVESSRVHIVMPTKSVFVEDEKPATASVVLKIRPGRELNEEQVQGIVHLVSSAVSGLAPKNVTVVDNYGKMLAGKTKKSTPGMLSSDQMEFQHKVETIYEERVQSMLDGFLGKGKAIVRVSCDVNFRREEKTSEKYDPDTKVVRSEQLSQENTSGEALIPKGIPGTSSNLNNNAGSSINKNGNGGYTKQNRTVNYEISKTTSHTIEPVGDINRISVAVIVDGIYKKLGGTKSKSKNDEYEYAPRSKEELSQLESIIKTAVNFNQDRGDEIHVANMPFQRPKMDNKQLEIPEEDWKSKYVKYTPYIKYGLLIIILVMTFTIVIRPIMAWFTSSTIRTGEILKQLPMTVGEMEKGYSKSTGNNLPYRDQAVGMITRDKEHSMELMKGWIKEKAY
jgi:flagellar M-ring protein FliF